MSVRILHGDCRVMMLSLDEASVDAIVTDPPYELGFMGKGWDKSGIAYDPTVWREALRVLKPGGHMLAFSGTRTYHRMACAIEDAGFEIRDQIGWLYSQGFPKSLDVAKALDGVLGKQGKGFVAAGDDGRAAGFEHDRSKEARSGYRFEPATDAARQWEGWGTALKPAWEPICMARKPLVGTVAANVLAHGTGALNIDGCRVPADRGQERAYDAEPKSGVTGSSGGHIYGAPTHHRRNDDWLQVGRWPANVIHDGSDEVVAAFPDGSFGDTGSAARFFYCAKADRADRNEGQANNTHPTVKPTDLMRYLCRLVTPKGGTVLDPFMGSGSTLKAAELEGFKAIGIELDAGYIEIARRRIAADMPLFADVV
jgi:hypothetical protein